jgi:hypothetical protein
VARCAPTKLLDSPTQPPGARVDAGGLSLRPGMRLPTPDSVRAIGVEIDRLRHANASRAKVEAYEHWRDRTVDFLFVDNRLPHARSAGRRTTGLRMRWLAALLFCRMAEAAACWHGV